METMNSQQATTAIRLQEQQPTPRPNAGVEQIAARPRNNRRSTNEQKAQMLYPEFYVVFSPYLFATSTLAGKASRCLLFAMYMMSTNLVTLRPDHLLQPIVPELQTLSPTRVLLQLRDWMIILGESQMAVQSLRNYGESNYSLLQFVLPNFYSIAYSWRHVWSNCLRVANRNVLQQAPIITIPVFRLMSFTSRLILLLLIQTSWRFHSITKPVAVIREFLCQASQSLAVTFQLSVIKYVPREDGLRKTIYCNCDNSSSSECCFIHSFQKAARLGIIQPGMALMTTETVNQLKHELEHAGLKQHSAHVSSAVATRLALRRGVNASLDEVNVYNNWRSNSANLFDMYTRWFNRYDEDRIIPMTSAFLAFLANRRSMT